MSNLLPQAPKIVVIYAEQTVAADGTITIRPLRNVVPEDEIEIGEAARISGLSERRLQYLCECGVIRTAVKPGGREKSRWRMSRSEILRLRNRQEVGK